MTGHEGHGGIQEHNKPDQSDHVIHKKQTDVSDNFKSQLKRVVERYIGLKEALVSDDSEKAQREASMLLKDLDRVDSSLLTQGNAQEAWTEMESKIRFSSSSIAATANIEEQRIQFKPLSSNLTSAIQVFGINQ